MSKSGVADCRPKCVLTITFYDSERARISQAGSIEFKYIAAAFARHLAWLFKRIKPGIEYDEKIVHLARKGFLKEFDFALNCPDCCMKARIDKDE